MAGLAAAAALVGALPLGTEAALAGTLEPGAVEEALATAFAGAVVGTLLLGADTPLADDVPVVVFLTAGMPDVAAAVFFTAGTDVFLAADALGTFLAAAAL